MVLPVAAAMDLPPAEVVDLVLPRAVAAMDLPRAAVASAGAAGAAVASAVGAAAAGAAGAGAAGGGGWLVEGLIAHASADVVDTLLAAATAQHPAFADDVARLVARHALGGLEHVVYLFDTREHRLPAAWFANLERLARRLCIAPKRGHATPQPNADSGQCKRNP